MLDITFSTNDDDDNEISSDESVWKESSELKPTEERFTSNSELNERLTDIGLTPSGSKRDKLKALVEHFRTVADDNIVVVYADGTREDSFTKKAKRPSKPTETKPKPTEAKPKPTEAKSKPTKTKSKPTPKPKPTKVTKVKPKAKSSTPKPTLLGELLNGLDKPPTRKQQAELDKLEAENNIKIAAMTEDEKVQRFNEIMGRDTPKDKYKPKTLDTAKPAKYSEAAQIAKAEKKKQTDREWVANKRAKVKASIAEASDGDPALARLIKQSIPSALDVVNQGINMQNTMLEDAVGSSKTETASQRISKFKRQIAEGKDQIRGADDMAKSYFGPEEDNSSLEQFMKLLGKGKEKLKSADDPEVIDVAIQMAKGEQSKAQDEDARKYGGYSSAFDFDMSQASSGSGGSPPDKPPTATTFPDDDDDESGRQRDDPTKDVQKLEVKRQKAEFDKLKREAAAQQKKKKLLEAASIKQRRKDINSSAQQAREQIDEIEKATSTDRIIRRLGSFGIARSIGSSGQLFASLTELFAFGPEEASAQQAQKEIIQTANIKKQQELDILENDILQSKLVDIDEQQQVSDILAQSKQDQEAAKDPQEIQQIIARTKTQLADVKSGGVSSSPGTSPTAPTTAGGAGSPPTPPTTTSTGTTPPPGGPGGPVVPVGPVTPVGPVGPVSPGGPGGPKAPPIPTALGGMASGLQNTTKAILAASIALEGMRLASEGVSTGFRTIGSVLSAEDSKTPALAVSAALGLGKTTGQIAGAAIGAGVGTAIAPGLGTLIGGAVGAGTAGFAIDPIVSAIEAGNTILANMTDRSIGVETVSSKAREDILTVLRKMQSDVRTDSITAGYATARGELARAIIELKESFSLAFGDDIIAAMRLVTGAVNNVGALGSIMSIIDKINVITNPANNAFKGLYQMWVDYMTADLGIAQGILDATEKFVKAGDPVAEMESFFATQSQFEDYFGNNRFGRSTLNFTP